MATKTSMLAFLRKGLLLYVLIMVALGTWLTRARSTDWNDTLWVSVYPINGDGSEASADYIATLDDDTFVAIEQFVAREGEKFGMDLERPLRFEVGDEVTRMPPTPPASRNPLAVIWWSLTLRHYARGEQKRQPQLVTPDIRLFVVYHDPKTNPVLAHSLGLSKGLIGVVNAFSSRNERSRNHVVVAHEILHTLGATDKYDPASNMPIYPDGYAEPDRTPRLPQTRAEIMAGRMAIDATTAVMPDSLRQTIVGEQTATEIRW